MCIHKQTNAQIRRCTQHTVRDTCLSALAREDTAEDLSRVTVLWTTLPDLHVSTEEGEGNQREGAYERTVTILEKQLHTNKLTDWHKQTEETNRQRQRDEGNELYKRDIPLNAWEQVPCVSSPHCPT